MALDREQVSSTIYRAINIASFHSPTMAVINMIIWGYILPRRVAGDS